MSAIVTHMKTWPTKAAAVRQWAAITIASGYPSRGRWRDALYGPESEPDPEIEDTQGWTFQRVPLLRNPTGPAWAVGLIEGIGLEQLHNVIVTLPNGYGDEQIKLGGYVVWDPAYAVVPLRRIAAALGELL